MMTAAPRVSQVKRMTFSSFQPTMTARPAAVHKSAARLAGAHAERSWYFAARVRVRIWVRSTELGERPPDERRRSRPARRAFRELSRLSSSFVELASARHAARPDPGTHRRRGLDGAVRQQAERSPAATAITPATEPGRRAGEHVSRPVPARQDEGSSKMVLSAVRLARRPRRSVRARSGSSGILSVPLGSRRARAHRPSHGSDNAQVAAAEVSLRSSRTG